MPTGAEGRELPTRFREHVRGRVLLPVGGLVVVGVSGRSDSVALSVLLSDVQDELQLRLSLLHVQHAGLPTADGDTALVRDLAERLRLPLEIAGDERAAPTPDARRRTRERLFADVATRRAAVVATAETREDHAECFLDALLADAAMPALPTERANGRVRPLLRFSHAACVAYLRQRRIPFQQNPDALQLTDRRQRLRLLVLPLLARHVAPTALDALAESARLAADDAALIREIATAARFEAGWQETPDRVSVDADRWALLPGPLRRRILVDALFVLRPTARISRSDVAYLDDQCRALREDATETVAALTLHRSDGRISLQHVR